MSFGGGHSTYRPLLNRLDGSSARLGRNRTLLRIRCCRRGLMLSGPLRHSMSAFYLADVSAVFFLVAFVLGAK